MKKKRLSTFIASTIATVALLGGSLLGFTDKTRFLTEPMTVDAARYSDDIAYGDYLTIQKVDEDGDGTYDSIEIDDCDTSAVSVKIPSKIYGLPVTSIGYEAFFGCRGLTSITIPDSVTSIGFAAFENCKNLLSITIPDSVTSIGGNAFGGNAFDGCTKLVTLIISDGSKTITSAMTSGLESTIKEVIIPDSITSIGDMAFYGCSSLENVYISDIAAWCNIAFEYASSNPLYNVGNLYLNGELVKDIVIPDSVTSIRSYAFYNCKNLASITIPDSVTSIGGNAFSYCSSLASITILNPKCEIYDSRTTINNGYRNNYYFNGTIYGYENSTAQAYAKRYDYNFNVIVEDEPVVTTTVTTETDTTTTTTVITTRYIVRSHVPTGQAFGSWTKTQETVTVLVKEPIVYEYTDSGIEDADDEILAEVTYRYEDTGGYAYVPCEWSDGTTSDENVWVKDSGFRGEASIYSDYGYSDNSKAELAHYSSIQEVYESNVENYGEDLIIEVSVIGSYSVYDCSGNTVEENNVLFTIPIKILGPNSVEQTTTTTTTATEPVTTTTSVSETVESSETTSENTTAPASDTTVNTESTMSIVATTVTTISTASETTTNLTSATDSTNTTSAATTEVTTTVTESTTTTTNITSVTESTTATSAVTTTTTGNTEYFASLEEMCEMAINDYEQKYGVLPENAQAIINDDGTVSIEMTDESGNVLDTYTIDPATGIGTEENGEEVNLPQTGNNSMGSLMMVTGAALLACAGFFAIVKSGVIGRKKKDE